MLPITNYRLVLTASTPLGHPSRERANKEAWTQKTLSQYPAVRHYRSIVNYTFHISMKLFNNATHQQQHRYRSSSSSRRPKCVLLVVLAAVVFLSTINPSIASSISSTTVVSFRQNLDQVLKKWNCNSPQTRLVYLGTNNYYVIRLILI